MTMTEDVIRYHTKRVNINTGAKTLPFSALPKDRWAQVHLLLVASIPKPSKS